MKSQEAEFKKAVDTLVEGLEKENASAADSAPLIGSLALVEIARQLIRIADILATKETK